MFLLLVFFPSCLALLSPYLRKTELVCASRAFDSILSLSFFSSTLFNGLTAASDCGTPWTFQFLFYTSCYLYILN